MQSSELQTGERSLFLAESKHSGRPGQSCACEQAGSSGFSPQTKKHSAPKPPERASVAERSSDINTVCDFRLAATEDGGVLLDIKNDLIHKLSCLGVQMIRALAAGKSEVEIIAEFPAQYDLDRQRVEEDLELLQSRLRQLGLQLSSGSLIEEVSPPASPGILPTFPWYAKHEATGVKAAPIATLCAFVGIAAFDFILSTFSLQTLRRVLRSWPTARRVVTDESATLERVCVAVERACVWYGKKALCLQRSAVTTCLLRNAGLPAQMVTGVQVMPLSPHAWVEIRGVVVNDHRRVSRVFIPIDRC